MAASMLYTYSTQRYDPHLKRQLSSISAPCKVSATSIRPFAITSKPSVLAFKGRPTDHYNLSHVLSTSSSPNPSSSRWHREHSGGLPTLAITEFSEGISSDNTSETSFHLSATHDHPAPKVDEGARNEHKQQLLESLLSVLQPEAHIPASSSVDCYSEETNAEDYDEQVQGQIRLVSSLNATIAEASQVRDSTATVQIPNNTQPPSPSRRSHQDCPECDSDYDEYPHTVASILSSSSLASSSSGYPDGEYSDDPNDMDLDDVVISEGSAGPSTTASADVTPSNLISPLSSPPSSTPPPTPFAAPNLSGIQATGISDNHEEEVQVIEITPKRATFPSPNTRRTPHSDPVSPSTIAPSPSPDGEVWWRTFQNHQRTFLDEHDIRGKPVSEVRADTGSTNVAKAESQIPSRSPQPACQALSHFQGKEPKHLPPPPSPSLHATRHKRARTKSSTRKVLSVIFPCIPVSPEEKDANEGQDRGSAPEEGSRVAGVRTRSIGRRLTKVKQGVSGKEGEVKRHSSGMFLEVKVERQTIRVVD